MVENFTNFDPPTAGAIGAGSFSNTDHVTYTYYCNGARATATDQRGVVHTYSYDYGVVGQGVEAKYLRPASVTYPGPSTRRVVYYNYPAGGIGTVWHGHLARESQGRLGPAVAGEAHGRDPDVYRDGTHGQDAHGTHGRDAHATASGGRTKYVAYKYLGASIVLDANHPAVPAPLGPGGLPEGPPSGRLTYGAGNYKANAPWHPDVHRDPGRALANSHGRARRARDARVTHGRDAHATPAYDQAGNMATGPKPDSPATPQVCTYDAWNRLMTVSEGSGTPTLIVTYSYDLASPRGLRRAGPASPRGLRRAGGQNRRIRKVVAATPSNITYDYYYNESWQVLEVRKGGSANPYEQYVWGAQYVDAPVVRFRDHTGGEGGMPDGTVDDTLYYMYDGNFNLPGRQAGVTAAIGMNGTVAERYVYDPYGQVTVLNGGAGAANWLDQFTLSVNPAGR